MPTCHLIALTRPIKFALVGALGSVLNLAAMAVLVEAVHSPIMLASAVATEIAIIHNFLLHRYWTFSAIGGAQPLLSALVRFNLSAFGACIFSLLMTSTLTRLGCWYPAAQALGIFAAWLANYHLATRVVFPDIGQQTTGLL